ncbi:PAQR family membrane homeostasis protein TrhA [Paenibacillus thermotolerans]|uniref:PAQR family membrane homeostasis protein TrhA n=1 Tax=Paenibacillus thermotolerans TaxID=3027807 RepID=UPI0023676FDB|nr:MULTISPECIES: hemolysin III family protein [unclassified Paenibacillus]
MANTHVYTKREEVANAITHGLGVVFSISALTLLVVFAALKGTVWSVVSYAIYGVTMVIMYTNSTLLHALPEGKVKDLFEIFDHSSIYLFIAGTYTPILLTALRGPLGWTLFGIVWGIAAGGVAFKAFFTKRFLFLSTFFYILMGWLIVFAWRPLQSLLAAECLQLLVAGGILYTVGSIFYVWRGFPFHHAVWHIFVLGGSIVHFLAILFML